MKNRNYDDWELGKEEMRSPYLIIPPPTMKV